MHSAKYVQVREELDNLASSRHESQRRNLCRASDLRTCLGMPCFESNFNSQVQLGQGEYSPGRGTYLAKARAREAPRCLHHATSAVASLLPVPVLRVLRGLCLEAVLWYHISVAGPAPFFSTAPEALCLLRGVMGIVSGFSRKLALWSLRELLFTNIVSWAMEKSGTTWSDTSEI